MQCVRSCIIVTGACGRSVMHVHACLMGVELCVDMYLRYVAAYYQPGLQCYTAKTYSMHIFLIIMHSIRAPKITCTDNLHLFIV